MSPAFGGQAIPAAQPPALTYNIIDLGTLGGFTSTAHGINDAGQVVGSADTAQGLRHAYLWENGVMIDLGTLGFPAAQSDAWDINNNGVVVGTVGSGDPSASFIWENGVQTAIEPLQVLKSAYGINDAKQVVGIFVVPASGGEKHAFLWQNGTMTDLGTLGGTRSIAWDINLGGQVAGSSYTANPTEHAFLWQQGVMTDLGTLGGSHSEGFDTNDVGEVVGWSQRTGGGKHYTAFRWVNGVMTDLGAMLAGVTSSAEAINNHGEVVGFSFDGGTGSFHGFVYHPQLGMKLLENMIPANSGWSELIPRDINDAGWIVGYGTGPGGPNRAFVMTPATVIPTVSEYGTVVMTLLLLTCGTIVVLRPKGRSGQTAP
jgi:probable HAF family extracellular repeat protein